MTAEAKEEPDSTVPVPLGFDEAGDYSDWVDVPAGAADHWDARRWGPLP